MFKWLFIIPLIVFIDPFLLYWVWPHLNIWTQVAGLLVYPLAATLYLRGRPAPDGDLATRVMRSAMRFAVWYPGPIAKLFSFCLLLPPVERAVAGYVTRRIQQQLLRGVTPPGRPGAAANAATGTPFAASGKAQNTDTLKRAKGRVVE